MDRQSKNVVGQRNSGPESPLWRDERGREGEGIMLPDSFFLRVYWSLEVFSENTGRRVCLYKFPKCATEWGLTEYFWELNS